jgi:hypothetical protein
LATNPVNAKVQKDFSNKSKADPSSFWKDIQPQEQPSIFCKQRN